MKFGPLSFRFVFLQTALCILPIWSTAQTIVTVDTEEVSGVSLGVVDGKPAIAYGSGADLKFVRAADVHGVYWGWPIVVDSGDPDPSDPWAGEFLNAPEALLEVNGNPAIAYVEVSDYGEPDFRVSKLKFIRASDSFGSSWGPEVEIFADGSGPADVSMIIAGDRPSLIYSKMTFPRIYPPTFRRALDPDGEAWGEPVPIGSDITRGASATLVNGRPAFSYGRGTFDQYGIPYVKDLRFIRASNSAGSTWGNPPVIVYPGNSIGSTSLATVNGVPAIAYYDGSFDSLMYVRASDANGVSWGAPVAIDAGVGTGSSPNLDLVVIGGKPAIAYRDSTNSDLMFVSSEDTNGSVWGEPVVVDSQGNVGWQASLAEVAGQPAIGYLEVDGEDLRYVRGPFQECDPQDLVSTIRISPSQAYYPDTYFLEMGAFAEDTLGGPTDSGRFDWVLRDSDGDIVDSGLLYSEGILARWWQAQVYFDDFLPPGMYEIAYSMTTDSCRTGTAVGSLAVSGGFSFIEGVILDGSAEVPLEGAQVALFDAHEYWAVIKDVYDGEQPSLAALLGQLTSVASPQTTDSSGSYNFADVPWGKSYIVVADAGGYFPSNSSTVYTSALNESIVQNLSLFPDTESGLAPLLSDVDKLFGASVGVLEHNAGLAGAVTHQATEDELFEYEGFLTFSTAADFISLGTPGLSDVAKGVKTVSKKALQETVKKVANAAFEDGVSQLIFKSGQLIVDRLRDDVENGTFPRSAEEFVASEYHQQYSGELIGHLGAFEENAGNVSLDPNFDVTAARTLLGLTSDALSLVIKNRSVFVPFVSHDNHPGEFGMGRLDLRTMKRKYMIESTTYRTLGALETVLSVVQVAGTAVTVVSVLLAPATGGASTAVAGVAYTATEVADHAKVAVETAEMGVKFALTGTFIETLVGAYPHDNGMVSEQFGNVLKFLGDEASAPKFLNDSAVYTAEIDVDLNLPVRLFERSWMFTLGWSGFGALAADEATVTITNTGNEDSSFRVTSYGVWSPVRPSRGTGLGDHEILTSLDFKGPIPIPVGGTKSVDLQYQGYAENFLSQFKPHYLHVSAYSGPWRIDAPPEPYYVIDVLSNPFDFSGLLKRGDADPTMRANSSNTVTSFSGSKGRMTFSEFRNHVGSTEALLSETILSASSPSIRTEIVAESSLYAIDLRLFCPDESQVAVMITGPSGQRLGFSPTEGVSYQELLGSVSGLGSNPSVIRLLEPNAGDVYTVDISLLTPGPEDVPVSLYAENVPRSNSIMGVSPSLVLVDSERDSTGSINLRVAEGSQQLPLTGVGASIGQIQKWGGSARLPVAGEPDQVVGDLAAGSQTGFKWETNIPADADLGKYVGMITASSNESGDLNVPVLALVRKTHDNLAMFEGTGFRDGVSRRNLTLGADGTAQTWVFVPRHYWAVHGSLGVVGSSTLDNPSIDVGANGTDEWSFSGTLEFGVRVENLEDAINDYIQAHPMVDGGWVVPIRISGTPFAEVTLSGVQVFLDMETDLFADGFETGGTAEWSNTVN